jgi:hypothetical protein
MFHAKKKIEPPDTPFAHDPDCRILKADPDVSIPWSRLEYGHWRRECVCSAEGWDEPAPNRVRLDPYDPATSRHLPQCEFRDASDPSILKALLKITPKDGYSWVECGACSAGWQVLDLAEAG